MIAVLPFESPLMFILCDIKIYDNAFSIFDQVNKPNMFVPKQ